LVATGNSFKKTVEIINLDPANPDLVCDNLQEYPVGLEGGTGQLIDKKMPIICGGAKTNRWVDSCDCYALQNQSWTKISSLNECRRYPASTLVSLEHEEEVLMITGGNDEPTVFNSVEFFDGTNWEQEDLSVLPRGVWEHCLVKINSTTLFLIGGSETSGGASFPVSATHFYDVNDNQWIPGPALNVARAGAGCGILNWMNPQTNQMEKIVVAAGGYGSSTTELLYVDRIGDYSWIMGPSLPTKNGFPSMVEFQNSVILIGGGYPSSPFKELYQLTSPGVNVIKHFLCH
jgi:Galactose oxidase, central domain